MSTIRPYTYTLADASTNSSGVATTILMIPVNILAAQGATMSVFFFHF